MPSLIEQIQNDALDENTKVATLLRKLKVAAIKLNTGKVEQWVLNELKGYSGIPPDYRIVSGNPMAYNPLRGWIAITGGLSETLSRRAVGQPISSLEDLVARSDRGRGMLEMHFPADICELIDKTANYSFGRYSLHVDRTQLVGVIDAVRNLVLDWATELDKAGVRGEGFSFSAGEKEKAQYSHATIQIGSIGTMTGNLGIGNTTGDIISSNIDYGETAKLAEQVERYLPALETDGLDTEQIQARLDALKHEIAAPEGDTSGLRSALVDLRNALSGAGGSLLASGIIEGISKLLGG